MKKTMIVAVAMLMCFAAAAIAQDLTANPDYQAAVQLQKMADDSYAAGDYDNAYTYSAQAAEYARKARESADLASLKNRADALIKELDGRFAKLDAARAGKEYPGQYETATSKQSSAKSAFSAEDYRTSLAEAEAAKAALDDLDNLLARGTAVDTTVSTTVNGNQDLVLPKYYVVRLIVLNRDCFWKIAAYSFIYNDAAKWPLLYEKNKQLLHQPKNPDLIHPRMVFEIPALDGETREGTYDPAQKYPVMPRAKRK
jgi:nucleoid-associated protein YgaU